MAQAVTARSIGPYRLGRRLGAGATGTVYAARGPGGVRVALKVFHPHLAVRASSVRAWLREAGIGRQVRSPRLVATLDSGVTATDQGPVHWVAMEYVEGRTVRRLVDRAGPLPEALCVRIGRGAAEALATLHDADVLHRDVKPENILLGADGGVRLMDLGHAAWRADGSSDGSASPAGTLLYASPEQLRGSRADLDGRSDLYALGVVLHEMASGSHPLRGLRGPELLRAAVRRRALPLSGAEGGPSERFRAVVRTLLRREPDRRFAGARSLLAALDGDPSGRDPTRSARPGDTRLHGRSHERATLLARWRDARAGTGSAVRIVGPSGIGKTRLVDETVQAVAVESPRPELLRGAYGEVRSRDVLAPWVEALRARFRPRSSRSALRDALRDAPGLLAAAESLLVPEARLPRHGVLDAETLEAIVREVVAGLSRRRPVLCVVEDAHHAPAGASGALSRLAAAWRPHRVLLLLTVRTDETVPPAPKGFADVALAPLSDDALRELVDDWLGTPDVPIALHGALRAASRGVPLQCLEALRELRDVGRLRRRAGGGWRIVGDAANLVLPTSLRAVLATRLARMPRSRRDVVDLLACVGGPALATAVARTLQRGLAGVRRDLDALVRLDGWVRREGDGFVLAHPLSAQAVRDAMPRVLSEALHDAWADELAGSTDTTDASAEDRDADVCTHRLQGGRPASVRRRIEATVRSLRTRQEPARALALVRRALARPGALDLPRRVRLWLEEARLARRTEPAAQVVAVTRRALDLARRCGSRPLQLAALREHADSLVTAGNHAQAGRIARRMRTEASPGSSDCAAALALLAHLDWSEGKFDRALHGVAAGLAILARRRAPDVELRLRRIRANVLRRLSRTTEALAETTRVCALVERAGLVDERLRARSEQLTLSIGAGRLAEAERALEETKAEARRFGHRQAEAHLESQRALVAVLRGRHAEGVRAAKRSLELEASLGLPRLQALGLIVLAHAESSAGSLANALTATDRASVACAALGDVRLRGWSATTAAGVRAALGQLDAATADLATAAEVIGAAPLRDVEIEISTVRGIVASARGDHGLAARWHARALAVGRSGAEPSSSCAEAAARVASALLDAGEGAAARRAAEEALARSRSTQRPQVRALPIAVLAAVGAVDADAARAVAAACDGRLDAETALRVELVLWRATGSWRHAAAARRRVAELRSRAPDEDRETMLANVAMYRAAMRAAPFRPRTGATPPA